MIHQVIVVLTVDSREPSLAHDVCKQTEHW